MRTVSQTSTEGPPLNKICDRSDWEHPAWRQASEGPRLRPRPGSSPSEGVGVRSRGVRSAEASCLSPDATALGLGAGAEPIIFFLAGRLRRVVATDVYAGAFSGQEADPRMLRDPEAFALVSYHRDRLEVRRMDATTIDYPPESFDLVFSFSSFEHFGSRRAQRACLAAIHRVLRPGGVAVLTTEVILNVWGRHGDYFRRAELLDDLIPGAGFRLAGGDFRFATSRATFEGLVRLPSEIERRPHLVLRRWRTYFTSAAFFLEKPVSPGHPEDAPRGARRGGRGRPAAPSACAARRRHRRRRPSRARHGITLTCRVENTGHATWPQSSPDGFGMVRLGAHLVTPEGASLHPGLRPGRSSSGSRAGCLGGHRHRARVRQASPGTTRWSWTWSGRESPGSRAASHRAPRCR